MDKTHKLLLAIMVVTQDAWAAAPTFQEGSPIRKHTFSGNVASDGATRTKVTHGVVDSKLGARGPIRKKLSGSVDSGGAVRFIEAESDIMVSEKGEREEAQQSIQQSGSISKLDQSQETTDLSDADGADDVAKFGQSDDGRWRPATRCSFSGKIMLKSVWGGKYLHVKSNKKSDGDPVYHVNSTSTGSEWEVKRKGEFFMLKNVRSGHYLHIKSGEQSDGDPVFHDESTSEGSQWKVKCALGIVRLTCKRTGHYLHFVEDLTGDDDPVYHDPSEAKSGWRVETVASDDAARLLEEESDIMVSEKARTDKN